MPSPGEAYGGRELLGEFNKHIFFEQTAASDGVWIDTRGIVREILQIENLSAGESITVHCSNNPTIPDDDDDEILSQTIAGDATPDKIVELTAPYSLWKKFKKTGAVGALTARYSGVKR